MNQQRKNALVVVLLWREASDAQQQRQEERCPRASQQRQGPLVRPQGSQEGRRALSRHRRRHRRGRPGIPQGESFVFFLFLRAQNESTLRRFSISICRGSMRACRTERGNRNEGGKECWRRKSGIENRGKASKRRRKKEANGKKKKATTPRPPTASFRLLAKKKKTLFSLSQRLFPSSLFSFVSPLPDEYYHFQKKNRCSRRGISLTPR